MARDLRNLASPTTEQPLALDLKADQEIIFQSEGRDMPAGSLNVVNTNRVRYCVSTDTATSTASSRPGPRRRFLRSPTAAHAPEAGWPTTKLVAENVVNDTRADILLQRRGLAPDVTEVTSTLYVDVNPGRTPGESTLQTSVYLRNQNRKPSAVFSLALANAGTAIIMNASESTDPEEKPLNFTWFIDGTEVDR